jgi:divalent metal cation (Fe/Co/Zn/Cd) transporter
VWCSTDSPSEEIRRAPSDLLPIISGILLFALAAFVTAVSIITLAGRYEPRPSSLGIVVLIAAATFIPWLASKKRDFAIVTGSAALKADAAESALCGYLSLIA